MPLAYQPDDRSSHHAPQQADRGGLTGTDDLTSMSAHHHDVPYWLVLPQAYGSMFGWSFQDQTQPLLLAIENLASAFAECSAPLTVQIMRCRHPAGSDVLIHCSKAERDMLPIFRPRVSPFDIRTNVGRLRTLKRCATSAFSSAFTLTSRKRKVPAASVSSRIGLRAWQGLHQGAQKSTRTGVSSWPTI